MSYTRIREHGTPESIPTNSAARMVAIRRIVKDRQYAKVDGSMIDLYTAGLILEVHKLLSPETRAKYASYPAGEMARIAYDVASKQR